MFRLVGGMPVRRDVHAADEGDGSVDDLDLPVIAEVEKEAAAQRADGLKPGELAAGLDEFAEVRGREKDGAELVEQHADGDAAAGGGDEGVAEAAAGLVFAPDEKLDVDVVFGRVDARDERIVEGVGGVEETERV